MATLRSGRGNAPARLQRRISPGGDSHATPHGVIRRADRRDLTGLARRRNATDHLSLAGRKRTGHGGFAAAWEYDFKRYNIPKPVSNGTGRSIPAGSRTKRVQCMSSDGESKSIPETDCRRCSHGARGRTTSRCRITGLTRNIGRGARWIAETMRDDRRLGIKMGRTSGGTGFI